MVGINIEASAEAVAQSVEFGAEDLHGNITGSSTGSRALKYMTFLVLMYLNSTTCKRKYLSSYTEAKSGAVFLVMAFM